MNCKKDPIVRFWSKVDKSGGPDACWLWTAAVFRKGYGHFWSGSRELGAHVFSFIIHNPEVSLSGFEVCHTCDVPGCVNPNHLWLGTRKQNAEDCKKKGRALGHSGDSNGARTKPHKIPRGERNGGARLTEQQVIEIRKLRAEGNILKTLATKFGVGSKAISKICRRERWAHVD